YVPKDSDDLPRPQALVNVDETAGLELRKDEDDRQWLVVEQSNEKVWPQLREFLVSNGFAIDGEDAGKGLLETGWLKPRYHEEGEIGPPVGEPGSGPRPEDDEPGFWGSLFSWFSWGDDEDRVRFRLILTQGKDEASSIVTINQVQTGRSGDSLPEASDIDWPDEPEDPEMVTVLYNELMDFLGEGGRQVGVSVLSQDLKALPKFVMTYDGNGYPVLVINQDFNRAWQDVGRALQRARIPTQDLDRSLGIYYLGQADEDDDEEKPLQLRLSRSETGVQVSVQLDDDTLAPKEESARILNKLRESLE
ncbi:MAG TPA: outer membrane protein assembly factor BamC, partial [Dongiaceae bacterium]|nr:outer membrane protein assembly factor BamC [Dongiaceae bacterium]